MKPRGNSGFSLFRARDCFANTRECQSRGESFPGNRKPPRAEGAAPPQTCPQTRAQTGKGGRKRAGRQRRPPALAPIWWKSAGDGQGWGWAAVQGPYLGVLCGPLRGGAGPGAGGATSIAPVPCLSRASGLPGPKPQPQPGAGPAQAPSGAFAAALQPQGQKCQGESVWAVAFDPSLSQMRGEVWCRKTRGTISMPDIGSHGTVRV